MQVALRVGPNGSDGRIDDELIVAQASLDSGAAQLARRLVGLVGGVIGLDRAACVSLRDQQHGHERLLIIQIEHFQTQRRD